METVLIWLAEGAVAYIGGKALSAIVGDPMLSDINAIVRRAVAEINAFTKRTIDENEIRKLVASLGAVRRNLSDYSKLTTRKEQLANLFLVEDAILKTSDATSQCASLGIDAAKCYGYAVSLYIMARTAHYKLTGTTAEKVAIRDMVAEAGAFLDSLVPPFMTSLEPSRRISIPNPPCRWIPGDGGQSAYGQCWLIIDGNQREVHDGLEIDDGEYNDIVNDYRTQLTRVRDRAHAEIQVPLAKARESWEKAAGPTLLSLSTDNVST